MSNEITKLTDEQKVLLHKYRDDWYKIGMSTARCNRAEAEVAITKMYAKMKLEKPVFHWCESPLEAQNLMNEKLKENENKVKVESKWNDWNKCEVNCEEQTLDKSQKQYIPTSLLGNQDAYWVAFYLFCRDIGVEFTEEQSQVLDIWKDIALNAGWWYAFDTDCFCVERPTSIHFNEAGQLDNSNGPAIGYSDSWGLYSIRGVAIPKYIVTNPGKITVEKIDKEKNIEIRRIMQDRMGISKYLEESKATLIHMDMIAVGGIDEDVYMPRALMKDKEGRQFLVGTDSSTQKKVFYMQVDPNATTCAEAHKSICGIDDSMIIANG